MVCADIVTYNMSSISNFLAYPSTCLFQHWTLIFAALFIIFTFGLYLEEKQRKTDPDLISSMGVSAIAVMVLATFGFLAGFVQKFILIEIIAFGVVMIAIWFIKGR